MGAFQVWLSAVREQYVKTFQIPAIIFLSLMVLLSVAFSVNTTRNHFTVSHSLLWFIYGIITVGILLVFLAPGINKYVLPERIWFDKNHFWLAIFAYTLFDISVAISVVISIAWFINNHIKNLKAKEA